MKHRFTFLILIPILLLSSGVLSGCSILGGDDSHADAGHLPNFLNNAPPTVRTAYEYAIENPDELAKYPCYCGCGRMGHTSNLSCFVREFNEAGEVVSYDTHALGCGICVDIATDVMRLKAEGRASPDIRAYIDATYSSFGPGTDTPFPEA